MKVIDVKKERIEEFHSLKPGNLFSSQAWCGCFDDRLHRYFIIDETDKPLGGFVAFEGGKGRLRTLITPPFSPNIGLFAEENKNNPVKINTFRKDIVSAMAEFLRASPFVFYKLDFAPEWHDMQPMLWKKIHTTVRYTYRIDLQQSVNEITGNLDSSKRNKISKADRDGLVANHQPDPKLAFRMIADNLTSNSLSVHPEFIKKILAFASDNSNGIYTMTSHDTKVIAANVCVSEKNICYNLLSAIDRSGRHSNAGTFGLYHSILKAKENGLKIFDFEGSGVPEIEEFFRSFGGSLIPYFSVSGGKWPWPWIMKMRRR